MAQLLSEDEINEALSERFSSWTRDGDSICRDVQAETFAAGIDLVDRVALAADEQNHHPDIDIRWTTVTFRLSSHSDGGLTQRDLDLAAAIDRLSSQ